MNGENYKRIVGSKDYFITDSGHIFRKIDSYNFKPASMYENAPGGYLYTNIMMKNGKQWTGTVHSLVAKYFIKKPRWARNLEINHKDGSKSNNHYSNLEWVSHKMNMKTGWERGQFAKVSESISRKRKSLNGYKTELSPDDVRQIRHLKKNGFTNKHLGYIYNLHEMQISRICNYRSFKDID